MQGPRRLLLAATAHLTVEVVEQLGADTMVHGHFGADRSALTLRLPGMQQPKPGERLPLAITPDHIVRQGERTADRGGVVLLQLG